MINAMLIRCHSYMMNVPGEEMLGVVEIGDYVRTHYRLGDDGYNVLYSRPLTNYRLQSKYKY